MEWLTRGQADPKGKPRVYISCLRDDAGHVTALAEELLRICDCAVFYGGWEDEGLEDRLRQMQLVVMTVTGQLLAGGNRCVDRVLPLTESAGIPVLPILMETGLVEKFAQVFGQRQFLDKTARDDTAIPYEKKLETYLNSVLIGNELATKIRAAFDAYIFLSYRKKDRKYAQELMGLIHAIPDCRDVAIWYDEYLVPGENFDHAIRTALQKCDVFALTVTPNLLQPGNYVLKNEYPEAVRSGKPILAAELVHTDRDALEKNFTGIPDAVNARSRIALADRLHDQLRGIVLAENDDEPEHMFFIGLAYLNGIDVEVDREKALELIRKAALAGLPEAAQKLAAMYRTGEGVERSGDKSALWLEYNSFLLCPEYIAAPDGEGDTLSDFLSYYLPVGRSNIDWFAHDRWRRDLEKKVALAPNALLRYIHSRWEYCDALRALGAQSDVLAEERNAFLLTGLLFDACPQTDPAVCYVQSAARCRYMHADEKVRYATELLQKTPEARRQLFDFYLTAGRSEAETGYRQKERDGYFRSAGAVLDRMEDLPLSEERLLRASLYDAMGTVVRRGYSYARRLNNPKNHKLLQMAYDLVQAGLSEQETPELLRLASEICDHRGVIQAAEHRKALRCHEDAAEYCRRLYELTRLPEDLDRHRQQVQTIIGHLSALREKDALREQSELLAALGGEYDSAKEQEITLRGLLKCYFDAACEVEDKEAKHWLAMCAMLQNRHSSQLSDGVSLRMAGLCYLRLGDRKRAAALLRRSWLEYADEEAARALPECGCYSEELRAILFALRQESTDISLLLQRTERALSHTGDEGLSALRTVLRGGMPAELDTPYGPELCWLALRGQPEVARPYLEEAMRRLAEGHELPLRVGEDMDALTVLEHAAMGCTLARSLEGEDLPGAVALYDAAARQLRLLTESEERPAAEMILLRVLDRLADGVEMLGINSADPVRREHRGLLVKLANGSGDEKLLRQVAELAAKRGSANEQELSAAMLLSQLSGTVEDKMILSCLAATASFDGISGGILLERILLVQEQLVRAGHESVKPQLARTLFTSIKEQSPHTPLWEARLQRIRSLLQPLPADFEAKDAEVLHAACYLMGEELLCKEVENTVIATADIDPYRRRAVNFAVDCLFDRVNHFADDGAATALLEQAVTTAEQLLSGGNDRDVLQIAALYQLCAVRTEGVWQVKADRMLTHISEVVESASHQRRMELLEGLGDILWLGGQHDRAEEHYLKLTGLEKEAGTQIHLRSYCSHCESMTYGFLSLGQTLRAKPWALRCVEMQLQLLELDYSRESAMTFWLTLSLIAEGMPEKDRRLFGGWFDSLIRRALVLAEKCGDNVADDLADIGAPLLSCRYFLWAAKLNMVQGEWGEVGFNIYCVFHALYEKNGIVKALRKRASQKEGTL